MELSDRTKILILVVIIGILIYFFIQSNSNDATSNEGALTQNVTNSEEEEDDNTQIMNDDDAVDTMECGADEECDDKTLAKFKSRNSAPCGQFAHSSYADSKRGGRASDLDRFFEGNHPLDAKKPGFVPSNDDGEETNARYVPGSKCKKKLTEMDKYNVDEMLPREGNKDWFDDPYEGVAIKSPKLINVYKPIGVNTIGSSMKIANRDIRARPINPKLASVSPWMNSSVEPDTNIREGALC
jgi:hypothetical protein